MKRLRFLMVGGFLGAGKTTAVGRLARFYRDRGQRVGVVTNDQAAGLVDTNSLKAQGLAVEEVAGACFCCRFDDLVGKVGQLESDSRPDVILAEPVGSCTDLVATVVQPLKDLYGDRFEVAPYAVLFKPAHGLKILKGEAELGWVNGAAKVTAATPFVADAFLLNVVERLQAALAVEGGEVAHLKAIGLSDGAFGVANLVSTATQPELSLPSRATVRELDLIVNARVALDPALIEERVRQETARAAAERGAKAEFRTMQSFRPGRPTPTHRYASAKG